MLNTETKKQRVAYNFVLEFPDIPFTVTDFKDIEKYRTVSYITLKKRVNKAIKDGELKLSGLRPAKKGRPQLLYTKLDVNTIVSANNSVKINQTT
jgi:hypothetical protein